MHLTSHDHQVNAEDFVSSSDGADCSEIDRDELARQLQYTDADAEDVEEIARIIESIAS